MKVNHIKSLDLLYQMAVKLHIYIDNCRLLFDTAMLVFELCTYLKSVWTTFLSFESAQRGRKEK